MDRIQSVADFQHVPTRCEVFSLLRQLLELAYVVGLQQRLLVWADWGEQKAMAGRSDLPKNIDCRQMVESQAMMELDRNPRSSPACRELLWSFAEVQMAERLRLHRP